VQAFIARRLLASVVILFFLSIAVFLMLRVAPGDPALLRVGPQASAQQIAAERERLGLNDPLPVQYWRWMRGVLTGDLGISDFNGESVARSIRNRLPNTLELLLMTVVLTAVLGITAGVVSAVWRDSPLDYAVRVVAVLGLSVPALWLATLALLVPLQLWGYAPPIGRVVHFFDDPWGNLRQFLPPALVLALGPAAAIMRLTRSSLLEVLRQDYIRTARAKGLLERVVISRHALRNAMIPPVTVLALQVSALLGGSVIIEQIFTLPGMGQYFFQAIFVKDYTVVQTLTLYTGVVVVLTILALDVVYAWLDPRIRYR
jgi:peptide/nickel transport system permease protein